MFDMNKSADRRQVLTVLGIILVLSCIPTLLVVLSHVARKLLISVLIGMLLYLAFMRKK